MNSLKLSIIIVLCFVYISNSFAQINFENGYIIDNDNQKINCLIKNKDWLNNPIDFIYKPSKKSDKVKGTIKEIKEFGIENFYKYQRHEVSIDRSSSRISELKEGKETEMKLELLYLKILVEGKITLFQYTDGDLNRFFYKVEDSNVEPLIFKNYLTKNGRIGINSKYKQQLLKILNSPEITQNEILITEYDKKQLTEIFDKYNRIGNINSINYLKRDKRKSVNINLRPGMNISKLKLDNYIGSTFDFELENRLSYRFGIETEFVLPFNKNKWAVIIEPTYQKITTTESLDLFEVEVDYSSVELPVGIRHFIFLNDKNSIFINSSFLMDFAQNSSIDYDNGTSWEIKSRFNFLGGIGLRYQNRFSLEVRYLTNREILSQYRIREGKYSGISIIVGYRLF